MPLMKALRATVHDFNEGHSVAERVTLLAYADDFVVVAPKHHADAEWAITRMALQSVGLELAEGKCSAWTPDDPGWERGWDLKVHSEKLPLLGSDSCGDYKTVPMAGAPDYKSMRGRRAIDLVDTCSTCFKPISQKPSSTACG